MKREVFLNVFADESGELQVKTHKDKNKALLAVADYISTQFFVRRNSDALNMLLGVVAHVVARDKSGNLEREFINNIKQCAPEMREAYIRFAKSVQNKLS